MMFYKPKVTFAVASYLSFVSLSTEGVLPPDSIQEARRQLGAACPGITQESHQRLSDLLDSPHLTRHSLVMRNLLEGKCLDPAILEDVLEKRSSTIPTDLPYESWLLEHRKRIHRYRRLYGLAGGGPVLGYLILIAAQNLERAQKLYKTEKTLISRRDLSSFTHDIAKHIPMEKSPEMVPLSPAYHQFLKAVRKELESYTFASHYHHMYDVRPIWQRLRDTMLESRSVVRKAHESAKAGELLRWKEAQAAIIQAYALLDEAEKHPISPLTTAAYSPYRAFFSQRFPEPPRETPGLWMPETLMGDPMPDLSARLQAGLALNPRLQRKAAKKPVEENHPKRPRLEKMARENPF